jgi:hypothetical protein
MGTNNPHSFFTKLNNVELSSLSYYDIIGRDVHIRPSVCYNIELSTKKENQ